MQIPDSLVRDWRKEATTNFIRNTTQDAKLIRQRLKAAPSRQKSYTDKHRRPLEFQVGDSVFLKVAPMMGVMRFRKKRKLSPKYIRPFEILERVEMPTSWLYH